MKKNITFAYHFQYLFSKTSGLIYPIATHSVSFNKKSWSMTDKEIIQGLIMRDNQITHEFFFVKCRPLMVSIIKFVFTTPIDYDELINELYCYLIDKNCQKLKEFQFRTSLYMWLKVVAIRFFIRKRDLLLDLSSSMPPYNDNTKEDPTAVYDTKVDAKIDIEHLLQAMRNERYAYVIRKLLLEGEKPDVLSKSMGITMANLYNIKKRAISSLSKVALKESNYGRE